MQDSRYMNSAAAASAHMDAGLRAYMLGVYNYMITALAVTGLVAYGTKIMAVTTNASGQIIGFTPFGAALFNSPLMWVVALAPLGMVMWLSMRIHAMSVTKAQVLFYIFAALMGASLSTVLITYTGSSVARAFFVSAGAFAGLSLYGYTTKRDLSPIGKFAFMALIGLVLAMIVNIFLQSAAFDFWLSVGGVLLFAGLTAYDTQRIKSMYMESDSHSVAQRKSIHGALALYLDFINMFLFLLRLFGNRQ